MKYTTLLLLGTVAVTSAMTLNNRLGDEPIVIDDDFEDTLKAETKPLTKAEKKQLKADEKKKEAKVKALLADADANPLAEKEKPKVVKTPEEIEEEMQARIKVVVDEKKKDLEEAVKEYDGRQKRWKTGVMKDTEELNQTV